MSFKIFKNNCCGLDIHKTWSCTYIGITDSFKRTEYPLTAIQVLSEIGGDISVFPTTKNFVSQTLNLLK